MPIVLIDHITRRMVKDNPEWLFLFGDNCARRGFGGQATEMRGEPNAVGVRTKWRPSYTYSAYFRDTDYDKIIALIDDDLILVRAYLQAGGTVVIPSAGLGTGMAKTQDTAPKVFTYLSEQLAELSNIVVDSQE